MRLNTNQIVWDVDTQNDIILPSSKFAAPGAYELYENFGLALKHFSEKKIPILGSVDAHVSKESVPNTRDENLPLHCIKGTIGQLKIEPTQDEILFVSDHKYSDQALDLIVKEVKNGHRVYIEKQAQSCESNPNTKTLLLKLNVQSVYIIGLLTNVCIRFAVKMFHDMGINTFLVTEAIKGVDFPGDTVKAATDEMLSSGTKIYSIKDYLEKF